MPCPRCDGVDLEPTAYAELLGWYLGDGYISRGRRGVYNLHVYNDAQLRRTIERRLELMRAVKPGGRPHTSPAARAASWSRSSWKHWPCLFPQHGPGRKHERPIVLEAWQRARSSSAHPADFLRGLFHSDGCRVANWTTARRRAR